ncbi:MAG: NAD(P)-binding domain-containing protein, partial [candidate division WOR-3 bacterium]
MITKTIGFIGGGRITRIFLGGLKKAGLSLKNIVISDTNADSLNKLKTEFSEINIAPNDNTQPAINDIVFLAVHPKIINNVLVEIKSYLRPKSILVSLAPNITIMKLSECLDGFSRIVRMIPNAPSIVNLGYNPVCYSKTITDSEKNELINLFKLLGECPEVSEDKLEAYAILTGMGPTYFWFQFNELKEIAQGFGLTEQETKTGIEKMVIGAIKTLFASSMTPTEVMDLIPFKPLVDE